MADTIITNVPKTQDSGEGVVWGVVLAIIIAAAVLGVVIMYQKGVFQSVMPEPETTNINVTVPTPIPTPAPLPAE